MRPMLVPFAAPCVTAEPVAADPPATPNVLPILAALGYSDLGCYGREIATPNLDALANNGLWFRRFSNGTRSCPGRSSLLTDL